jgi:hypothetical protein
MQTIVNATDVKATEVKTIEYVEEIEPATFQLVVTLEQGRIAAFRMNAVTLQSLMAQIALYSIP